MGKDKGKAPARAYAIQQRDQHDVAVGIIVDGMVLVSSSWAHVLFDTSASHSFISTLFTSILGLEFETLSLVMSVGVLFGRDCELSYGCSFVRIEIGGR